MVLQKLNLDFFTVLLWIVYFFCHWTFWITGIIGIVVYLYLTNLLVLFVILGGMGLVHLTGTVWGGREPKVLFASIKYLPFGSTKSPVRDVISVLRW